VCHPGVSGVEQAATHRGSILAPSAARLRARHQEHSSQDGGPSRRLSRSQHFVSAKGVAFKNKKECFFMPLKTLIEYT
jgi:hypothetical protein